MENFALGGRELWIIDARCPRVKKVTGSTPGRAYVRRTLLRDKTIRIDGQSFVNTDFDRCTLVYGGTKGVSFVGCKFVRPRFVFDGPAANTMNFVRAMYHGGAADLIERTFEEIRANAPISITYN